MAAGDKTPSRRKFLGRLAAGIVSAGSLGRARGDGPSAEAAPAITRLSEHLIVVGGPILVGVVRDGSKALLIDCGDARVCDALPALGITAVDQVLFTHHHRDQACGAHRLVARGTRLVVPARERAYFDDVASYWENPKSRWHIYNQHPHHLMLAESVPVAKTVSGDDVLTWGPATIRVLDTPGHTDGAVSYVIDVDGKRVCFSGDTIYDAGQIWELTSLQKGTQTTDYHGFLGAREELVTSLRRITSAKPATLVPSHGRIMTDPARAVDGLVRRLDRAYDKYVAISALRHYFPKMFTAYAGRSDHMAIRKGKAVPDCLRHIGTTWMLRSESGAAFVMDCGSSRVVTTLKEMRERGEIASVEGLWVTHYHDDHVDAIPEFQKTFDCPCITDRFVARVITQPLAWRLPCVSPSRARVDRPTRDGETWTWREFKLTAYHFPGQTLYHAGLFVEGRGVRMLFVGDSFTMGGIDDYCAQNRNWLGRGVGFDRCIALIEKLRPTHIFNCHVGEAFDFTPEQCRFMRANLAERERLFGALFPWEHANFGMDASWAHCFPYEQRAKAGQPVEVSVCILNHASAPRDVACRTVMPRAWRKAGGSAATPWRSVTIPPKQEGAVKVRLDIPATAGPGRYVIPVDLRFAARELPRFTEAMVVL